MHYDSVWTDSARWAALELRGGDVILSTPPKSGTTWAQAISMMILLGRTDLPDTLEALSPWLESTTRPAQKVYDVYNAQEHRRLIKSHTPFDGLPYDPDVTYICVYRHPLDVHFSMRNHMHNMKNSDIIDLFPDDLRLGAQMFIENAPAPHDCDRMALETIVRHYQSFANWQHLPNIHMFHYADMQHDPKAAVLDFAQALGYSNANRDLDKITQASSFGAMKANANQYAPAAGLGIYKNEAAFFRSAKNQKWLKHLTAKDIAAFDVKLEQLLPADRSDWLKYGSKNMPIVN